MLLFEQKRPGFWRNVNVRRDVFTHTRGESVLVVWTLKRQWTFYLCICTVGRNDGWTFHRHTEGDQSARVHNLLMNLDSFFVCTFSHNSHMSKQTNIQFWIFDLLLRSHLLLKVWSIPWANWRVSIGLYVCALVVLASETHLFTSKLTFGFHLLFAEHIRLDFFFYSHATKLIHTRNHFDMFPLTHCQSSVCVCVDCKFHFTNSVHARVHWQGTKAHPTAQQPSRNVFDYHAKYLKHSNVWNTTMIHIH